MTEPTPFNLQTEKRAKFNEVNQGEKETSQEYEPLWKQVKDSFSLRPDNYLKDMINVELETMM